MQINRTTLLDKDFWALLKRHRIVTQEFDKQLPPAAVERILFDPTTNVQIGILYLRELLARLVARVPDPHERTQFALMAYNTGPTWTFGLDNPLNGGELLGGALKLARRYRVPLVFDTVAARSLQGTPLYRTPIRYLDERGRRLQIQMRESDFRGGLDYTRTVWATFQVLLQLAHPDAPLAGLEERGIVRRSLQHLALAATLGLGVFDDAGVTPRALVPSAQAQPVPTAPPAGDKSQFLLGPWLVSVLNGELVRSNLADLRQPILRMPADRPLTFARIHRDQIYAVGTGGVVYRLDPQDQLQRVLTLDDDLEDMSTTVITDMAFVGDTLYVVADESSTIPIRTPPGGAPEFSHAWRVEAYSIADPAAVRRLQRHDLVTTEGVGREPDTGLLEIIDNQWIAVTVGDRGVRVLRAAALQETVATLSASGVTAMHSTVLDGGSVLAVAHADPSTRGSRVTSWQFTPAGPVQPIQALILPTAAPIHSLEIAQSTLYLVTGHTLLIYGLRNTAWELYGQLAFAGDVHELNVLGRTAYVLQRFSDGNALLHTVNVTDPQQPRYGTQYADLGEVALPLAVSKSGRASVRAFRVNDTSLELRFYNGQEPGVRYDLPSNVNPTLRAVYTQDEQFVFLVVEVPFPKRHHQVFVLHHQTGRPWFQRELDLRTQSRFVLTDSYWHGVRGNQVQLEYQVIGFDGSLEKPTTLVVPLAPPQGGLEERVPEWMARAIPTGALPGVVGRVHAQAAATPKVAVLFDPSLLADAQASPEDQLIQRIELAGQIAHAVGHAEMDLQIGDLDEQALYEARGYRVIRVVRHPESTAGALAWSAVPVVVAQAMAVPGALFPVNLSGYGGLEDVTLSRSLSALTDLFA
ncbi:MAG: transglycosylase SLT domain-containing protein [Candidatus Omnitrophica bacterium]|nr:transglycosylase SLT domain-containing protein [Candidatus Omnitrophota bacterium]